MSDLSRRFVTKFNVGQPVNMTEHSAPETLNQNLLPPTESLRDGPSVALECRHGHERQPNLSHANQAPALEVYDLVILGDGTGSTLAAWTFASKGQRVAVIERKYIGGSCPNIACLPSKNILQSARVASYFPSRRRVRHVRAGLPR